MIELNVEHDPVFRPMIDKLLGTNTLGLLLDFAEGQSIALDDTQRDALGMMGHRELTLLLKKLFRSEHPQEDLDQLVPPRSALGFNGDD